VIGAAIHQSGYDHQGSYKNDLVQRSTLHAIARLALKWDGLQR
jgi:hypothetical protein